MILSQLSEAAAKASAGKALSDKVKSLDQLLSPEIVKDRQKVLTALATVMTQGQIDKLVDVLGLGDDAEDQEHIFKLFEKGLDKRLSVKRDKTWYSNKYYQQPCIEFQFKPISSSPYPEVRALSSKPRSKFSQLENTFYNFALLGWVVYVDGSWRYHLTNYAPALDSFSTKGWDKAQPQDILKAVNAAAAKAAELTEAHAKKYLAAKAVRKK